jgi:hypothetical protein
MQFDIDASSEQSELFFKVRDLIMNEIGDEVYEKLSDNITSYFSSDDALKNQGFCYLRTKDDYVHIGWFRGVFIEDKYGFLFGNGKRIRGHIIKKLDKKQKDAIKYYINETKGYIIEHNELKKLK